MTEILEQRIVRANDASSRPGGDYVLYWMTSQRRGAWNLALDHAVARAEELGKPLVVLEALRAGYRWASDRLHRFVLEGMRDNREAFDRDGVLYHPYVEPRDGAGKGLLEALAERACLVVGDEFPCFELPRINAAAARRLDVSLELVDGNGILPLRAAPKVFARAHDFRRFLQKNLVEHLGARPSADPLERLEARRAPSLDDEILDRWPAATPELLEAGDAVLAELPIDHDVAPAPSKGGAREGESRLERFLEERLGAYMDDRNMPDEAATSELSAHLHFGHVGSHRIVHALLDREDWSPERVSDTTRGQREGWWGVSPEAEAFLDQVVTWREVGYNMCHRVEGYDRYDSLPDWALRTLDEHRDDERPQIYSKAELEDARTHDEVWNAAQRQLLGEGRIHNYLRMLWGKKILEWSPSPEKALEIMIALNDRWALDGRNPNSYSGIFWVLGRYDRAWGPERPIYGKIRYMSSENTVKKLRINDYLDRWSGA